MFDKVKFGHFPVLFCGVGFYSSASYLGTFPAREGRRIPRQFRFLHSYYSRVALLSPKALLSYGKSPCPSSLNLNISLGEAEDEKNRHKEVMIRGKIRGNVSD